MFLKFFLYNFLIIINLKLFNCHGPQRYFMRRFDDNSCRTPLQDRGSCVSLKFCPEVLSLFSKLPLNSAKQYTMSLRRECGDRVTPDNYPIVCCTSVSTQDLSMAGITTTSRTTTTTPTTTESVMETGASNKTVNAEETSCFTKDFKAATCKPLQNCPSLFEGIKRDQNNEELKADLRAAHVKCESKSTLVCCPPEEAQVSTTDNAIHRLPTEDEGCGLVNVTLDKIVGGEESQIGAWPWMALIGYDPYSVKPFRCGGTLVTSRHVITAAHCILRDLSFVRLGEFDISIETETRHVDINVIKHARHPEYGKNRRSDVAVLLLEHSVQFTEFIAPICMPNSMQLRSKSYIDAMPHVAGWGLTMQSGSGSKVLKQAQMPIQKNEVCRQIYRSLLPSIPPEDYDESIFCAGYTIGGADTCQGDSGGPLMIPELYKGIVRYYLIGVVSYGHGCGKVPSIYINVQKKMDWFLQQIQDM